MLRMEPIDYSKYTMEQLIEIRKELSAQILKRASDEDLEEMLRVKDKLTSLIGQYHFERGRSTI